MKEPPSRTTYACTVAAYPAWSEPGCRKDAWTAMSSEMLGQQALPRVGHRWVKRATIGAVILLALCLFLSVWTAWSLGRQVAVRCSWSGRHRDQRLPSFSRGANAR